MAAIPKKLKFLLFGRGAGFHARVAMVLEVLGLACLIVGILSGALNRLLGLWSTEWFLITIALWILGLWSWLCAYTAAKER